MIFINHSYLFKKKVTVIVGFWVKDVFELV